MTTLDERTEDLRKQYGPDLPIVCRKHVAEVFSIIDEQAARIEELKERERDLLAELVSHRIRRALELKK